MLLENIKELSDEEIFLKIQENPELLSEIIDRYKNKLDNFLKKISNFSKDERDDILQEVFITIYQKYFYFEKGQKFSSWIYQITHRKMIDYWRKNKKRDKDISIEDNLTFVESRFWKNEIEEELEMIENQELLKKLFSKLPLKYKEIFILRFEEEKSYEEIAEILKIPISSVGTLISRAKKKLKEEYQKLTKNNYE